MCVCGMSVKNFAHSTESMSSASQHSVEADPYAAVMPSLKNSYSCSLSVILLHVRITYEIALEGMICLLLF